MIFGVFQDYAQLLEVLGVWLAAGATFTATYVALRIANRANEQFVEVDARPMVTVTRGVRGSKANVFHISATNVGMRSVTIKCIVIKSRWPRYNALLLEGLANSSPLPLKLSDGEHGNWIYPEQLANGENWYRNLAQNFCENGKIFQWMQVRNLRFFVVTTVGKEFMAPASNGLREKVWERIKEVRQES